MLNPTLVKRLKTTLIQNKLFRLEDISGVEKLVDEDLIDMAEALIIPGLLQIELKVEENKKFIIPYDNSQYYY